MKSIRCRCDSRHIGFHDGRHLKLDKYVVMMGPLHIEMAGLKMLGDLLVGSGSCEALAQANVAGEGSADSFLRASHVGKTRRAHQVTAAALHVLQRRAFMEDSDVVKRLRSLSGSGIKRCALLIQCPTSAISYWIWS